MQLWIRVLYGIINAVYLTVRWVTLLIRKKPPGIPGPLKQSLFMISATDLAKKIRQKEVTCYHVVNTYIERIKELNPYLNVVAGNRYNNAVAEAKKCDEYLKSSNYDAKTLETEKPLYGVPFTVKEACAVKGCSFTGCNLLRKGMKATSNAESVEILQNAGAIPLCVTTTPEMCGGVDCSSLLFGHTSNPYDTRYTPGGSSGGEGAIIGAGGSLIGLGSDFGGSVRIPASFNGVFGMKATRGIIPSVGHIPYADNEPFKKLFSMGPLTRYAEDLELVMKVVTAKCDRPLNLNVPVDLKQLKIYYQQDLSMVGLPPAEPEIKESILNAAKHFMRLGNSVDKLPMKWDDILEIIFTLYANIDISPQELLGSNNPQINPLVEFGKSLFGLSQHTSQTTLFAMILTTNLFKSKSSYYPKQGEKLREELLDLLGQNGVLIYPTFRTAAIVPQVATFGLLDAIYSAIFNYFGFPAVSVPMGLNRDRLPLGVQVIAAPYQDRLCIAVAKELEKAFGGWVPPYPVSSK